MKTDAQIQQDVLEQFRWDPLLNANEIGVSVKHGVVTLSGQVDSFLKKVETEREARKVSGVKAIAEDIQVGISKTATKTDAEIAEAVVNALSWHTSIPDGRVKAKVEDAIVTLSGEVDWRFQRESARNAVVNLLGVRSVVNNITIAHKVTPDNLKQKINSAFHRIATIDSHKIDVEILGNKVILKGSVLSLAEKQDAEDAVWSAPCIMEVDN